MRINIGDIVLVEFDKDDDINRQYGSVNSIFIVDRIVDDPEYLYCINLRNNHIEFEQCKLDEIVMVLNNNKLIEFILR